MKAITQFKIKIKSYSELSKKQKMIGIAYIEPISNYEKEKQALYLYENRGELTKQ